MIYLSNYRPWARELSEGDVLTSEQAAVICLTRLHDFGLDIREQRNGKFRVVAWQRPRLVLGKDGWELEYAP